MISKSRVEAFSDAIIAIIITIMALELPLPQQNNFEEIKNFILAIFIFFDSFVIIGNFWHQHCKLFRSAEKITEKTSWRNLLFLFIIALFPLFTKWVIKDFENVLPAISYLILFVLANLSSRSILVSMLDFKKERPKKNGWKKIYIIRFVTFGFIAVGSLILSYFKPVVSNTILIGLPLITSLSNTWIEKDEWDESELIKLLEEHEN